MISSMPKISVIMPVYNGEGYIRETIESVLTQTYADFEFIIIDDGSTDKTLNIVREYTDGRIVLVEVNHGGIVSALNAGLHASKGEYAVRIDADDVCDKTRFEKLVGYMDIHSEVVVCGSWAHKINEKSEITGELTYPPANHADIKKYALLHNPFIHPSVIFRISVAKKVGMYKKFKHTEDYEFWTRMLGEGEGYNIPEKLINYRVHSNQITRKHNLKMKIVGVYVRLLAAVRLLA